jgi:hypothetical protein
MNFSSCCRWVRSSAGQRHGAAVQPDSDQMTPPLGVPAVLGRRNSTEEWEVLRCHAGRYGCDMIRKVDIQTWERCGRYISAIEKKSSSS